MADTCIFCGKALRRGWSLYILEMGVLTLYLYLHRYQSTTD